MRITVLVAILFSFYSFAYCQSSYLSGLLKHHHHLSTRDDGPTPEDNFLQKVMVKRAIEAAAAAAASKNDHVTGGRSEEAFAELRRPDYLEYCKNAGSLYSSNKCSCKALVCKPRDEDDAKDEEKRVCMFASVQMKMALSCTLKRPPSSIEDFENMTQDDCSCKFSHL